MTSPLLLIQLTDQMKVISDKLDTVQTTTTKVQKTATELTASRRKTWWSIGGIIAITTLDILATVLAFGAFNHVDTLVANVICPTDSLYLKTYTPLRAATYPGGLPAYQRDIHTIYIQYTNTLNCSPRVIDPTTGRH